jgi:hypothetical protein
MKKLMTMFVLGGLLLGLSGCSNEPPKEPTGESAKPAPGGAEEKP